MASDVVQRLVCAAGGVDDDADGVGDVANSVARTVSFPSPNASYKNQDLAINIR